MSPDNEILVVFYYWLTSTVITFAAEIKGSPFLPSLLIHEKKEQIQHNY